MSKPEIQIPKNRLKQFGLLLSAILLEYVGYLMIKYPNDFESSKMSPEVVYFLGFIGCIFFGFGIAFLLFDLFSLKPAICVNSDGIYNNSSFTSNYFIRWNNINSIRLVTVNKKRMIKIDLKNEDEIYQQVNFLKSKILKLNAKFFGTPVIIADVLLKMKIEELFNLMKKEKYYTKNH
jgi:hypothetical protein